MLQSKLTNNYPTADPSIWLKGDWRSLDPILAGRLAYYAKCKNKVMVLNETYRSSQRQQTLYDRYLYYKRTKDLKKYGIKLAAKPGSSSHEYRLAADVDKSHPLYHASNEELKAYGLVKPLISKGEFWHVQPVEAGGTASKVFKAYAPIEMEEDLTREETLALIKEVLNGKDTTPSTWANESWTEATKQGVVDGTRPLGVVTRQELAKVILNK